MAMGAAPAPAPFQRQQQKPIRMIRKIIKTIPAPQPQPQPPKVSATTGTVLRGGHSVLHEQLQAYQATARRSRSKMMKINTYHMVD
jgi:hypothetical protein